MRSYVYRITHIPTGRIYVGKTRNPSSRWSSHKWYARHGPNSCIARAMQKHGIDEFTFSIVEQHGDDADAYEAERRWIRDLRTMEPPFGFNRDEGGPSGTRRTGMIMSLAAAQRRDRAQDDTGLRSTIADELCRHAKRVKHPVSVNRPYRPL